MSKICKCCEKNIDDEHLFCKKYHGEFYCEFCYDELLGKLVKDRFIITHEYTLTQYFDISNNYLGDDYNANSDEILNELTTSEEI